NRTCSLRCPETDGNPYATRMEIRSPDSTSIPHALAAGLIASGIDGIKKRLRLRPKVEGSVWKMGKAERAAKGISPLPGGFEEALALFVTDCSATADLLPNEFVRSIYETMMEKISMNTLENTAPENITSNVHSH
ncbi:MAG: hypothetical protein HQK53_06810, partial [Oligoflexia bacterium]|nr:hypothetical protein [Oligoflexia bacterium]